MQPFFTKTADRVMAGLTALGFGGVAMAGGIVWYYFTPEYWEVGYRPEQPVPFSHQIHAGKLGMDCRYCHFNVEHSHEANVPPTAVCMGCHTVVDEMSGSLQLAVSVDGSAPSAHWESEALQKLRAYHDQGEAPPWKRIHKLPDYVRFNHAAHVNAGVSCFSCHKRIDQMSVVRQAESLSMAWCLECHRDPSGELIDLGELAVTDLEAVEGALSEPGYAADIGEKLRRELRERHNGKMPPQTCAACHY